MDKFKTFLNIANKQTNLGFGLVSLLTAGGEQIFSSVLFKCPCNELNFMYGTVFLLVPAMALLLLGYILSKKMWKMITGVRLDRSTLCRWRKLFSCSKTFFQISTTALVAPTTWVAVALLNGKYFECAMTGTNMNVYNMHLCKDKVSEAECLKEIKKFPCSRGGNVPTADKEDVLLTLQAQSQILGWLLIASIMLSNLLLSCVARCTSPISYFQLKFWRAYAAEEDSLIDLYTSKHAKELADRNLTSFFSQTPPADLITPSNKAWERISSLYKFSTKNSYYSTLHKYVEKCQGGDIVSDRMASVRSADTAIDNPAVLTFVDEGRMVL